MSTKLKSRAWFYGLVSGVIGGSATSGASWLAVNAARVAGADMPALDLKALGIILATAGVTNALAYLAKSPLPAIEESDTDLIRKGE